MIIGIDPGTFQSAYVEYENGRIFVAGLFRNEAMMKILRLLPDNATVAIEHIRSYGNIIGQSTIETCIWIGRFQAVAGKVRQIERVEVRKHICQTGAPGKATDASVRWALMDRFGGSKRRAVGIKKAPGPLYHFKKDMWSALAIAITAEETDVDYRFEKKEKA